MGGNKILLGIGVFAVFILLIVSMMIIPRMLLKDKTSGYTVDLEVWGVFDASDAYKDIFQQYKDINPFVGDITYRKFPVDTYERDLLDALAAGKGPDLFMIRNAALPLYKNKIIPAPTDLIPTRTVGDQFPDVVVKECVDTGDDDKTERVYCLPLSVDSLGLYYNKDIFNAAGIVAPPKTWDEFVDVVQRLRRVTPTGDIEQAAVAMGTADNVNRATDILAMIMMQGGAAMSSDDHLRATFHDPVRSSQATLPAGEYAMQFYTQFARPSSYLTWSARQHYSIDAFVEGNLAMMFNYSWQMETVRRRNERLNVAVAPIPQLDGARPVTIANYWSFAVAANREIPAPKAKKLPISQEIRTREAWSLLSFMALKHGPTFTIVDGVSKKSRQQPLRSDPAAIYLEKTGKPAARKDLIDKQRSDVFLGPFALGNLIARAWYQKDPTAVETVFAEMITSVVDGRKSAREAVELGAERVTRIYRQ